MNRVLVRALLAILLCIGWSLLLPFPEGSLLSYVLYCVPPAIMGVIWFGFEIVFIRFELMALDIKNLSDVSVRLIKGGILDEADLRIREQQAIEKEAKEQDITDENLEN